MGPLSLQPQGYFTDSSLNLKTEEGLSFLKMHRRKVFHNTVDKASSTIISEVVIIDLSSELQPNLAGTSKELMQTYWNERSAQENIAGLHGAAVLDRTQASMVSSAPEGEERSQGPWCPGAWSIGTQLEQFIIQLMVLAVNLMTDLAKTIMKPTIESLGLPECSLQPDDRIICGFHPWSCSRLAELRQYRSYQGRRIPAQQDFTNGRLISLNTVIFFCQPRINMMTAEI